MRHYRDLEVHRSPLPQRHLRENRTSPERTALDLARSLPAAEGLAVLDTALRSGVLDLGRLTQVTHDCRGWPGITRARAALEVADGLAESPLESRSRWWMPAADLPRPELQVPLGDALGPLGRVDFWWQEHRVAGEADGLMKYTDAGVLYREKLRQERLEQAGLTVIRWGWRDVSQPSLREQWLQRLARALA